MTPIMFDVDGVIANCTRSIILWNKLLGRLPEEYTEEDVDNWWFAPYSCDFECFQHSWFWRNLQVFPGAPEQVQQVRELGFRPHFVTACPDPESRRFWLERHFQPGSFDLVLCDPEHKLDYCLRQGIDFAVEDRQETCLQLATGVRHVYCVARPYNQGAKGPRIWRGSLEEIVGQIRHDRLAPDRDLLLAAS